jgi:molybdopterin converting factor small subunit
MKIKAFFHGILSDWVGVLQADINLPDGGNLGDLLSAIRHTYGHNMPEQLWDEETNRFNGRVLIMGSGGKLDSPNTPLREGEEVKFYLLVAGG